MTHPPETASTVTLIGIPGFWPSGASGEYQINFRKKREWQTTNIWVLSKKYAGLKQKSCPLKSASHFEDRSYSDGQLKGLASKLCSPILFEERQLSKFRTNFSLSFLLQSEKAEKFFNSSNFFLDSLPITGILC